MSIVRFKPTHAIVNNAPAIISVAADAPVLIQRTFLGTGAPSATTLGVGNGRYCGLTSGFMLAATLVAAGTGYVPGDTAVYVGGTFTQVVVITVDAVTATGAILDWHVSTVGAYSVYPANPVSVSGGTGSGATFNLGIQPPDAYLDITTPTAPVLYVCQTAGTNSSSVWAKVSGGGSNWNYRGLWTATPASPYMTYDVAQFGAGTAAGMDLSTIDSTPNTPDTGIGWLQVSSSSGTWL